MSEQLHAPKQENLQSEVGAESGKEHLAKLKEQAEKDQAEHAESGKVEALKKSVETKAISGKELNPAESGGDTTPSQTFVSRELKEMALRRNLNNARRAMNSPERVLSKVMHNKVVESVSDAASSTVARPSGILGGGIFALLGTSILLWTVKHYGYTFNYLMFLLLFVGGFAVGLIVEFVLHFLLRKKQS